MIACGDYPGPPCPDCGRKFPAGYQHECIGKPAPQTTKPSRHFERSWAVANALLPYFDSYKIGSVAPLAAEIEKAMDAILPLDHIAMPVADVQALDAIVQRLGIQEDCCTPLEAIDMMGDELEQLR